jgi:hypothetical protein
MQFNEWNRNSGYRSRYEEERTEPLTLSKKQVVLVLEVDTTATDYGSHQVVLKHPAMDGQLVFDVDDERSALSSLEDLEVEAEEELLGDEPEPAPEPSKPATPEVKRIPEPAVQQVNIPSQTQAAVSVSKPVIDPDKNPVLSIMSDIAEICDLVIGAKPKVDRLRQKFGK